MPSVGVQMIWIFIIAKPNGRVVRMRKRIWNYSVADVMHKQRALEITVDCNDGKRSDGKLSRFVWREG